MVKFEAKISRPSNVEKLSLDTMTTSADFFKHLFDFPRFKTRPLQGHLEFG